MIRLRNLLLLFLLLPVVVRTQTTGEISISDFKGTMSVLASGWMEGREAGEKGCAMAADYVASVMESYGLQPFGDSLKHENQISGRSYFQNFTLIRYTTEEATLSFADSDNSGKSEQYSFRTDFRVYPLANNFKADCLIVFAGYGISLPEQGYDDYSNLELKNKIVVMLSGFPGSEDTTSFAWKKIGKILEQSDDLEDEKRKTAQEKGALAVIEISEPDTDVKPIEPEYEDYLLLYPTDTSLSGIPFIELEPKAAIQFLEGSGIHLKEVETLAADSLKPSSAPLHKQQCNLSVKIKKEAIKVKNVLGVIYGKDSACHILIGAHYDHLGKRDTLIYYGADDNASGTAGMLALAKYWRDKNEQPPCNIVFAAWTAEEEGMLGSSYYTDQISIDKKNTRLYVNLDMISRSDPADSLQIILSVGTMKGSDSLKEMISKENSMLEKPFILDP
ncbi:MAG: M20/M25/M40 family metallo-hydrolase, partial [Bacteroidetes bacterium]|nr:M20/M25/M40 family metallo-hydrolase [Bacteroidota bacterium]